VEVGALTGCLVLKNRLLMPEEGEVYVRSDTEVPSKGLVEGGHNDLRDDALQCEPTKEVQQRAPITDIEMLKRLVD
jgi:hypothetical protein